MALAPWGQSGQQSLRTSLEERETSVLWSLCSCCLVISWAVVTSQPTTTFTQAPCLLRKALLIARV